MARDSGPSRRTQDSFTAGLMLRSTTAVLRDAPYRALLVLAQTARMWSFREERSGSDDGPSRTAGRRIVCSLASCAAPERDRGRLFIGPGWLTEPRVRIARKGRRR